MIYGELGITPLLVDIKSRQISFWTKLIDNITGEQTTKLSSKLYQILLYYHDTQLYKSPWIDNIKTTLCHHGFSGIWYCQNFTSSKWLNKSATQKIKDINTQNWYADIKRSSDTSLYKHLKTEFKQSPYITQLPTSLCKSLIAFRTRNHRLPIETGRWHNIPQHLRKCNTCNTMGDEYHFIIECSIFNEARRTYIDKYFLTRPNYMKLIELFNTTGSNLKNLAIFCNKLVNYKF